MQLRDAENWVNKSWTRFGSLLCFVTLGAWARYWFNSRAENIYTHTHIHTTYTQRAKARVDTQILLVLQTADCCWIIHQAYATRPPVRHYTKDVEEGNIESLHVILPFPLPCGRQAFSSSPVVHFGLCNMHHLWLDNTHAWDTWWNRWQWWSFDWLHHHHRWRWAPMTKHLPSITRHR